MHPESYADDISAIRAVVARQFESLHWTPGTTGDWSKFVADFFPGAMLYPAARPAACQAVEAFVARMQRLAETTLRSFDEALLGAEIRVFGNVAMAIAACQMTENDSEVRRGVEMLLLIKNGGKWQIASQAWDTEGDSKAIPSYLVGAP